MFGKRCTYPAVRLCPYFLRTLLLCLPYRALIFLRTYPAVPLFFAHLLRTLLCLPCRALIFLRTYSVLRTLLRPYFSSHSRCAREKKLGHSRVSKKQDNRTAEVSAGEKKITAQQGKCLKNIWHSRVSTRKKKILRHRECARKKLRHSKKCA